MGVQVGGDKGCQGELVAVKGGGIGDGRGGALMRGRVAAIGGQVCDC